MRPDFIPLKERWTYHKPKQYPNLMVRLLSIQFISPDIIFLYLMSILTGNYGNMEEVSTNIWGRISNPLRYFEIASPALDGIATTKDEDLTNLTQRG